MLSNIFRIISGFFTSSRVGILLSILFSRAATTLVKEITDKDNQRIAYEFVKALNNRTDMTNSEKAKVFNQQMLEWAGKVGRKMGESVINCLRELAVNAVKCEKEESK